MDLAVLLIAFNRPDTAEEVLDSIRRSQPSRLYLAVDGPREDRPSDVPLVDATKALLVSGVDWPCKVRTLFRTSNLGSRLNVVGAVDWFFENESEGVVVEDDCKLGPDFLSFCRELLEKYRENSRVMCILGDNSVNLIPSDGSSYGFIKYGWPFGAFATWKSAWARYDRNLDTWIKLRRDKRVSRLWPSRIERKVFSKRLDDLALNPGDIWDLQWSYSIDSQNGLSVFPAQNLISNIGFSRKDATHTRGSSLRANHEVFSILPLTHPAKVENDRKAERAALFGRMWGADRYRLRYWVRRFLRKASRRVRRKLHGLKNSRFLFRQSR